MATCFVVWAGVFQMRQSFLDLEQRLLQTTADLLNRRAEVQQLKDLIQAAALSRHSLSAARSHLGFEGKASSSQPPLAID